MIETGPNTPLIPGAIPNPMVRAPMDLGYLPVAGGYARVRPLPNPSMDTPQLRVAEDNAHAEENGFWSPDACRGSLGADGTSMQPGGAAGMDPTVHLPLTVPALELPPAIRAILGDNPAIDASLAPGRAAVATTIAAANSSMATTFAVLSAIPTIAASRDGSGRPDPPPTLTPLPIPVPTPDPSE
ncbi:MAG: hypothetical protein EXR45_02580 [Chloroflexi bacterium]|nr:hypothetical protein [Chloroflexota bacterium]